MSKRSRIIIDHGAGVVAKTPLKWKDIVFERERYWLSIFGDSKHFPKFVGANISSKTIFMTYCGEPLTKDNIPDDLDEQIECILLELGKYNCCHNDIKPSELLVKDGKLYLVDFGWATEKDEPISSDWPPNLGGDFRFAQHKFDDRYSIMESVKWILHL